MNRKKWYQISVSKIKKWISLTLTALLISGGIVPSPSVMVSKAEVEQSVLPTSYFAEGGDDMWEKAESHGEVLITFPSRIYSSISSAEDVDVFGFTLEEKTDIVVTLDSLEPCRLLLSQNGVLLEESDLPHEQSIERAGLAAGVYAVTVIPQRETEKTEYDLNIRRQTDKSIMPDYSEMHIAGVTLDRHSPYRWRDLEDEDRDQGGHVLEVVNYLAHWQGPVKNAVAPYYDKGDYKDATPSDYVKYVDAADTSREYHIPNVYLLPTCETEGYREHWKNALMVYGGIDSGFSYIPGIGGDYLYLPEEWTDSPLNGHATLIVGWDDTIPKEAFETEYNGDIRMPDEDGAWICKDSYGVGKYAAISKTGYFYISYDDARLGYEGYSAAVFADMEQTDNYSHLYSNSPNGMLDTIRIDDGEVALSQVFHTDGEAEMLRAAAFAVLNHDINYQIYVRIGDEKPFLAKSGYEKYGGFHTERLDSGIMIPADTDFEVIVAVTIPNDSEDVLAFCAAQNIDGWIDGIKGVPEKSYAVVYDEETEMWEHMEDISDMGIYPSIFAYTYAPTVKEQISLLDIREDFHKGSDQEEADHTVATDSNAGRRKTSSITATDSNALSEELNCRTATGSDALRAEDIPANEMIWENLNGQRSLSDPVSISASPLGVILPSHYNLKDEEQVTIPKHQGNSNFCWTFAAAGAMESSYLKGGSNLTNYPNGLNLYSEDGTILDSTIKKELRAGEELPVSFTATLFSDSECFNPDNNQIYWEIKGDLGSVEIGDVLSESGVPAAVLTAKAAGTVKVTAVSLADSSLRATCTLEITEKVPAKVSLDQTSLDMFQGDSYQLHTSVEADEELEVRYSSDTPSVADVNADGTILALRPGTAVITAKAGEGMAACTVKVRKKYSSSGSGGSTHSMKVPNAAASDTISGVWVQDGTGWWLKKKDGSYPVSSWEQIKGEWYYFNREGYMAIGWVYDDFYGGWFYLNADGSMATGWIETRDGKWYYLNPVSDGKRGVMYSNTWIESYYLGTDGAWIPGRQRE